MPKEFRNKFAIRRLPAMRGGSFYEIAATREDLGRLAHGLSNGLAQLDAGTLPILRHVLESGEPLFTRDHAPVWSERATLSGVRIADVTLGFTVEPSLDGDHQIRPLGKSARFLQPIVYLLAFVGVIASARWLLSLFGG